MNYIPRSGLNVPSITVTDDGGKVIAEDQRRVFRHLVQDGYGANVIFGNGTTGEWNRLNNLERQRVIELEIDEVGLINERLIDLDRPPWRRGLVSTVRPNPRFSPTSIWPYNSGRMPR
jgi:hypothetical protein